MKRILQLYLLLATCTSFANRIYVNPLATGINDGSSWTNAFTTLQKGFDKGLTGDTVLVAAGVYKLTAYPDRGDEYTFGIYTGIAVLGGYPNSGNPTDAQRDWVNNPSIISGEIYGSSNPYVLLLRNIGARVELNGLKMIKTTTTGLRIDNCPNVLMKNMLFEDNGGRMIHLTASRTLFVNCVLFNNSSQVVVNESNAYTSFYNSVVANNTSYPEIIKNQDAELGLYNCTFASNLSPVLTGTGTGSTIVKNCIFWDNHDAYTDKNMDIRMVNHPLTISNCITQTYFDNNINTLLVNYHPRFLNPQQPAGTDNKFFTADDGLQLTAPCSPALNYGDNSAVGFIPFDLLGNPRLFNAGTVDLGAYEVQQTPGSPQRIIYVNNSIPNTGIHDGSSWATAFTTLQAALLYCADTIKIAEGTYLTTDSWRNNVFNLESGKVIIGGYPASGNPTDAERDPRVHHTILKGNYSTASTGRNSPVIRAWHTNANTVIDGIRFTNYQSTFSDNIYAVEVNYESKLQLKHCNFKTDAALDIKSVGLFIGGASTPTIYRCEFNSTVNSYSNYSAINCVERSNTAISYSNFTSGTTSTNSITVNNATLHLDSCVFWKNLSDAGAIFLSTSNNAVLGINNCLFRSHNNSSGAIVRYAGNTTGLITNTVFRAIGIDNSTPIIYSDNSHLVYNKCLFDSSRLAVWNVNHSAPVFNNCVNIRQRFMLNERSTPVVNNCTLVNNYFPPQSIDASARRELVTNNDSTVFTANNTIFWSARLAPGENDIKDQMNSSSILTNCLTQNYGVNGQNGNIVGKVPRFNRPDLINGPDGTLFTADDGLQLAPCSPAINTGNATLGTVLTTDILNNPRVNQTAVDMGAYELPQAANNSNIYYVNSQATGNSTGTSWDDAYTNLHGALCNACADTILVAAGTYKPAVSSRDSAFVINRPLALYGGYPATGNPAISDRDAIKNPTILSGDINSSGDSLDNSGLILFVNAVTDSVDIEGFVIRDSYMEGGLQANAEGGGGLCIFYSNAGVRNCRFERNHASLYGGGISVGTLAVSSVSNCIFTGNSAGNSGGGLHLRGDLKLNRCVFENNFAPGQGGAIYLEKGTFAINNTVLYRNYVTYTTAFGVGGGLYTTTNAGGRINNCSFVENKALYTLVGLAGGGAYTNQSRIVEFRNCIFSGNLANNTTNAQGADYDFQGNYTQAFGTVLQYPRLFPLPGMSKTITEAGFAALNDPKGPDGQWMTKDDGLQLNYASPAINIGVNSYVQNLPVDVLGETRIVLDTVDAGAYEYQNQPVALAGKDTLICAGDPLTIGRTGNPKHSYTWTSNPAGFTSTSATPVVNPSVATMYYLEASNGTDVVKDTIAVAMSNALTPAVSVVTPTTTVCAGTSTIFTAIPTYEGTSPAYQWFVNGMNAGTDTAVFTTPVQNGDKISVQLTSSASCASPATATSNVITMNATPLAIPQVTINGPLTFCVGDSVTYTATPVDGGTKPVYQWVKNGFITTNPSYDNTYTSNNISSQSSLFVIMVSNAVCQTKPRDSSNILTVNPNAVVNPAVTVSASQTTLCGVQPVTFTAQATNTGTNPQYQWKLNGNNVGTNSSQYQNPSLSNGDNVYVVMTTNLACARPPAAESNKITMTITGIIRPTISIAGPAEVKKDSVITVTATVLNAGGGLIYTWQDSTDTHGWQEVPGAITATAKYKPARTGDYLRCQVATTDNCGSGITLLSTPLVFKVNTVTGIDPVSADAYGISSWPNPVVTYLVIDHLKLSDQWQTLEITSTEGRQKIMTKNIAGQTQVTLTTGTLKAGLYIVTLRKKNGELVYLKFVKL